MPSRFGSPRGSIPRILREAGEIADARMRSTQRYLDDFTAADDPKDQVGGGAKLPRRDFVALLRGSPDFQQQIANRWAFASAKERESLLGVLRQAFPAETGPSAIQIPPNPAGIPPEQQGTGMGGPPQGAGPVGAAPLPQPGMAPPGAPGSAPPPGGPPMPGLPPPTQPGGPALGTPGIPSEPAALPPPIPGGMAPMLGAATAGPPGAPGPLVPPVPSLGPASAGLPGLPALPPTRRPSLAAGMV